MRRLIKLDLRVVRILSYFPLH